MMGKEKIRIIALLEKYEKKNNMNEFIFELVDEICPEMQ